MIVFGIVTLGALAGPWLPWWSLAAVAFVCRALAGLRPASSLLAGLLAGFLLWGAYAGWIDLQNEGVLSVRVGRLFGGLSSSLLVLVTALFGGLLAGLGAWTAALGRLAWSE